MLTEGFNDALQQHLAHVLYRTRLRAALRTYSSLIDVIEIPESREGLNDKKKKEKPTHDKMQI